VWEVRRGPNATPPSKEGPRDPKTFAPLELRKQFFSEERTKRLLSFDAIHNVSVMTSTLPQAQGQKSFGSFLQKRTLFLQNSLISLDFFPDRYLD
jgi:hypothetical protein